MPFKCVTYQPRGLSRAVLAAWILIGGSIAGPATAAAPPHLEQRGAAIQLVVEDRPFLMLAGELHNSSSSSVRCMEPLWPRLAARHLNTVLVPVAWETIEPEPRRFDCSTVERLLTGSRNNHLKLVVLWSRAWIYSTYVPAWVKADTKRFPRVQLSDSRSTERLSPFSTAVRDADSNAFARLMQHLHETDATAHTVLMVQVENEVGVIPESLDHSPGSEAGAGALHAAAPRHA